MAVRIATGVVLIALVLVWLFLAQYPFYTMGALLMYMVAAYEMAPLLRYKKRAYFVAIAAAIATAIFAFAPPGEFVEGEGKIPEFLKYIVLIALPFWIIAFPLVKSYPKVVSWHNNIFTNTIFGLCMLVPFLVGLLILRATNYAENFYEGGYLVLAVMALVWAADSGAYFTGRSMGKNKLMPEVSPKKTLEGLYGGIVLSMVVMYLAMHYKLYSVYGINELALTCAAFAAILFSVLGDLVESMLKRMVGIKDSGKILPGHGGVLDRIDSQLAAVPMFLCVYWLISGEILPIA